MFRNVLVALALSVAVGSASSTDVSAARHDAEVAQMQFAQFLRARNAEVGSKRVAPAPKATIERLHALREQPFVTDASDGRKLAAVTQLAAAVTQVERAKHTGSALPKDFRINEAHPTRWRAQPMGDDLAACRNALEHDLSTPLRLTLANDGTVWLRISAPAAGTWAFDTFVTEFDTRLSLYRDCREIGRAPLDTSDDALGLGSIVGFSAKTAGETRVVKLERIGGLGDLVVAKGGTSEYFTGRVTRQADSSPIYGIAVAARSTQYGYTHIDVTNTDGGYSIYVYYAGDYRIRTGVQYQYGTHPTPELIDEAYPGVSCAGRYVYVLDDCDDAMTTIAIAEGEEVTDVDFALDRGAAVVGRVVDESTGSAVPSASVQLIAIAESGGSAMTRSGSTDLNGRFRVEGLPAAQWRVEFSHAQFVRERWNDVQCGSSLASLNCPAGAGMTVSTSGAETIVLDADLQPLDVLPLRVTSDGQMVHGTVVVYTANGFQFTTASSSSDGTIYIGPLPPGEYRFVVNHVNQSRYSRVYGGPRCFQDCLNRLFDGQVVTVPTSLSLPLVADLEPFPQLSGVVSDASTGLPLGDAEVDVYTNGYRIAILQADQTGYFRSGSLVPENYFVHARAKAHVDELFPEVPCESDMPLSQCGAAQPVTLGSGGPGEDLQIALSPAGTVQGRVRVFDTGNSPLITPSYFQLTRLTQSGSVASVDELSPDALGNFAFQEIPAGTHVFAGSASGYRTQLYAGADCVDGPIYNNPSCLFAAATRLSWAGSEFIGSVNFDLSANYSRLVRVRDAETLAPVPGVVIDQWTANGVWKSSSTTNALGIAQIRVSNVVSSIPATYTAIVTTDNLLGYLDQVHDATECAPGTSAYRGNCSLANATVVPVYEPTNLPYPRLEILLRSADPLFNSDFE